jgi:tetratricopeptide (TPR) repeat protein
VVELDPDDAEARCCLGNTLREQARYDDALEQFRKALELAPDDPMPCAELCLFYHESLHDDERALLFGEKFLALGGQDPDVQAVLDLLGRGYSTDTEEPPEE